MDTGNNRTENRSSIKSDDYLWDRSGEPDPEIQHLETLLGRFRYDSPTPIFPVIVSERRWAFFPADRLSADSGYPLHIGHIPTRESG